MYENGGVGGIVIGYMKMTLRHAYIAVLQAELQRMKQMAAESKAYIEAQEAEERKLLKIISEADAERVRQKKELDQVPSHYSTL